MTTSTCRHRLIRWCERHAVGFVIGLAANAGLRGIVEGWEYLMEAGFKHSQTKQRRIPEFAYVAHSRGPERYVITRLEFAAIHALP